MTKPRTPASGILKLWGEASKFVPDETKLANPEIEWKKIGNYCNLLIHEYFGVNLEIVWDIIEHELPDAVHYLQAIIDNDSAGSSLPGTDADH